MSNDPIKTAIESLEYAYDIYGDEDGPWPHIEQALTALRQHQQDGGWRPIETAPKDGTRILAFVPPYGAMSANFSEALSPIVNGRWNCHGSLNREAIPTLWQPLPPAPKKENDDGGR